MKSMSTKTKEQWKDCKIESICSRDCRVIYTRRWIATTACWIGWEVIWIHLGEYSREPWTSLRWCSRPNQAEECLLWSHPLWLFSLSYTISLGNWSRVFLIQLRTLCDNLEGLIGDYCKHCASDM